MENVFLLFARCIWVTFRLLDGSDSDDLQWEGDISGFDNGIKHGIFLEP